MFELASWRFLDETRATVTKHCFFLIEMSARPPGNLHGYLILIRQDSLSASTLWGKEMTPRENYQQLSQIRPGLIFSYRLGPCQHFRQIFYSRDFHFGYYLRCQPSSSLASRLTFSLSYFVWACSHWETTQVSNMDPMLFGFVLIHAVFKLMLPLLHIMFQSLLITILRLHCLPFLTCVRPYHQTQHGQ